MTFPSLVSTPTDRSSKKNIVSKFVKTSVSVTDFHQRDRHPSVWRFWFMLHVESRHQVCSSVSTSLRWIRSIHKRGKPNRAAAQSGTCTSLLSWDCASHIRSLGPDRQSRFLIRRFQAFEGGYSSKAPVFVECEELNSSHRHYTLSSSPLSPVTCLRSITPVTVRIISLSP